MPESPARVQIEEAFLAARGGHNLVALPIRLDQNFNVYAPLAADFVKELRHEGVDIAWADQQAERLFLEQRSAALDVVQHIVLGVGPVVLAVGESIAGAAIWDRLSRFFGSRSAQRVRLDVVHETSSDGSAFEWVSYEGQAGGISHRPGRPRAERKGDRGGRGLR